MPINKNCEFCGKEFFVKPSRAEEKKFCSRECKHRKGRVELVCLNCNKIFTKIAYRSDAIFCDRNCKTQYANNKYHCQKCGKEFTRGKAYQGAGKFCSIECRRSEICHGVNKCEKCGIEFPWRRGINQVEPRFCSLECRGHTGFRPGAKIRISELTEQEKLERLKKSFEKNVIRKDGCWGWRGSVAHGGYPVMTCRPEIGSDRGHRASYLIYKGPIPKGMSVCHSCDNPICTNPEHLWIGTSKENNDDKIKKGRENNVFPPHKKGSANGASKLTEEQVREIKILLEKHMTSRDIGDIYGVSKTTILRIKTGQNWSHITC